MANYYDAPEVTSRRQFPIAASAGISVPGTAAADTVLVRIPITDPITIDKVRLVCMTGGTAAGPTVKVQYSLAGTGAAVDVASKLIGTAADNASFNLTVTSTSFAAGDHLLITNVAGTAASTPKVNLMIGYQGTF